MGATYSTEDIRALVEASVGLTSELKLETVLRKVVAVAREQIRARYAALSVLNKEGEIEQFISSGITQEERARIGSIPAGRGLLGVLLHDGTSLRIDDVSKDSRSVGFPPNHPTMKSLLGVPVVSHGRIVGNLYLTEKQGTAGFDERDEELLRLLSAQAAVAIRNAEMYEAQRQRADESEALFTLSREVTATTDLHKLLESVVQRATRLLDAEVALLLLLSPDGAYLIPAAQTGLRSEPRMARRLSEYGLQTLVVQSRQLQIVADYRTDQRVVGRTKAIAEEEELVSAIVVPLLGKDKALGTLIVGNRCHTRFTNEQSQLLQALGNLAAVATERRQLDERLESLARLEERDRIGMDLHDGVIQSIYAVALHLEDCSERLPEDAQELKPDIEKAMDDLNKVIKDIRSYIFDLHPQLTKIEDLPDALFQLVEHFRVNTLVTITLDVPSSFQISGGEAEAMALFQIAQEALNNISKHAGATSVTVRLSSSSMYVTLEVLDNGKGFEVPAEGVPTAHHGLRNMRDRARSVGSELVFESTPGRGTLLRVSVPVLREEASGG